MTQLKSFTKKETRNYPYTNKEGKIVLYPVTYSLSFTGDVLKNVFNEYGCSVEKSSECWSYFDQKYNQ